MTRREPFLALKPHRFSLIWTAAGCLLIAGAAALVAAWLASYAAPAACLDPSLRYTPGCSGYPEALAIDHEWAERVMAVLGLLPFVVGIVIGVPLVAAEIETGTAVLVWSLDASRRRWLLTRVVIFGTVLTVLLMIPAAAGNLLERFRVPRWEPDTTIYLDFGSRGWLFVERGLVTFAIAVTAGLLIGRVLQGLVVAGLAASVLLVVLNAAHGVGLPAPAPTQVQPDRYVLPVVGAEPRYVDANGRVYSPEQIRAAAPAAVGTPEFFAWFDREGFLQVQFGIPGERLWIVEAREFAVGSAGAIMVLAGATWLAGRRRPY